MKQLLSLKAILLVTIAFLAFTGCSSTAHPGVWSEAEVETKIKNKMGLEQLELETGADGLTGSGFNAEGESFQIEVKQDVARKRMDYIAKGDRGTIEEGFFETE